MVENSIALNRVWDYTQPHEDLGPVANSDGGAYIVFVAVLYKSTRQWVKKVKSTPMGKLNLYG